MPELVKTVLVSLGSSAVVFAALGWLLKTWLEERLKKAIEFEYDKQLKALEHGYNEQLEKLRVQLQGDSLKAKEELEHDRKVFERLTSYCGETTFRDACGTITDHGFYDYEEYKPVMRLEHYGIQDENQFANPELRAAVKHFHACLNKFMPIVARNFFATGKSGDRYFLYPELKNTGDPEGRKIFEDARTETTDAGVKVLKAFSEFRQAVKQKLFV